MHDATCFPLVKYSVCNCRAIYLMSYNYFSFYANYSINSCKRIIMKLSSNLLQSQSRYICMITFIICLWPTIARSSPPNLIGCHLSHETTTFYHESPERKGCFTRILLPVCSGHCQSTTVTIMNEFLGIPMQTQDGRCCTAQRYALSKGGRVHTFTCPDTKVVFQEKLWYARARNCECLHS